MATKLESQYHIPQSDKDTSEKHGDDGGEYNVEAVEALLEPERQPYYTDQGPEPVFSDKALIVMAIFAGHTNAEGIRDWIKGNFENPSIFMREGGIVWDIRKILMSDDDFVPDNPNWARDDDHCSPLRAHWKYQRGLWRLLSSMRDTDGHRFSPHRHIKRHVKRLESRAALDSALTISKYSFEEQQLSASEVPTSVSDGGGRMVHQPYVSSRSPSYPSSMLGGSTESSGGGDFAMRFGKHRCWEHGCNGRLFLTFSSLIRHQRRKSGAQDTSNSEDAASSIKPLEVAAMSHPWSLPEPEPLPGVAEIDHEPRPQSSTSFEGEEDAGHKASNEGSGHELTDDDAQTSIIDAALDYQIPVKGRLVNGRTFGLSLQQEHGKDSQRSTTGGEDGCSTQEQSGRSSHTARLDDSKQASSDGPDDHKHLISSILYESPLPETSDLHKDNANLSKYNRVSSNDGTACTVLELLLEPQWASCSRGNQLERLFSEKALILMAFGHTEPQTNTKNWNPAIRRISTQDVMQLYHRLPARLRRRVASAYRAAAEGLYSSKIAHIHLSFQFVHEKATNDSTDSLRHVWRVTKDFRLGHDSISPRIALAMGASVEQHLLKVSKSMIYINKVQTDLRVQTQRCLERDSRDLFACWNMIGNSTLGYLTQKDEERLGHILARIRGAIEKDRLHSFGHTEDVHATWRSDIVSLNSRHRRIKDDRAIARLTELAFVFLPACFVAPLFSMQTTTKLELEIVLFILCLGLLTSAARNLRPSERIIKKVVRQFTKAEVPQGMKRLPWQCRCGKLIYDDYFERKPYSNQRHTRSPQVSVETQHQRPKAVGAAERIEDPLIDAPSKNLNGRGAKSFPRQHGQDVDQSQTSKSNVNSLGSIWTSLGNTFKDFRKAGPTLPQHDTKSGIVKKVDAPPKPDHLQFLLLCIPYKSHANKLMNIDTTTPPSSDIAFFRLLRQTYAKNRGRFRSLFSIRSLSEIRVVQFEVFRNDLADVRKFDCIPPEAQKDNYLYRPMPAEFEPPIGKNQMMHLYDHPDHADDVPVCYSRVPRKLRERLSAAPGIGRSEGWGICFIEGVSWPRVCALGLVGVLASTIFGIAWTVVQKDIQGGFGVASYMLGVLVLGLGALQGAFEM